MRKRWGWWVNLALIILTLIVFLINVIVLPRVIALDHRLRQTCESSNKQIVENNEHFRSVVRQIAVGDGRTDLARQVKDAPLRNCSTGKPVAPHARPGTGRSDT